MYAVTREGQTVHAVISVGDIRMSVKCEYKEEEV